jgi:uncharacterized protein YegP (UPF0339 family)
MLISALARQLTSSLLDFLWDEWGQIGVFASSRRVSPWAEDPEALILMTLEAARSDARLFDEVLDWVVENDDLISRRRLRTLCLDDDDRLLVEATLTFIAASDEEPIAAGATPKGLLVPLFHGLSMPSSEHDPAFASSGWLRAPVQLSGKSSRPDLTQPINLAFRLRQFLGVGVRAEVVRLLLASETPWVTVPMTATPAGYNRRNVQEALTSMADAGLLSAGSRGNPQRYAIDRVRWAEFLGSQELLHLVERDWPRLFGAIRRLLRWLRVQDREGPSEYMRASRARALLDELGPELEQAGIRTPRAPTADMALTALEDAVATLIAALDPPRPSQVSERSWGTREAADARWSSLGIDVTAGPTGFGWQLRAPNGRQIATAAADFKSEAAAIDAAQFVLEHAPELHYDVYRSADGGYRWRARAPNHEVVALSPDAFSSQFNATRALERLRGGNSQRNIRHVVPNLDGGWDVQAPDAHRASARAETQRDAVERAREIVLNSGGGEVVIHNSRGQIRDRETIPPRRRP